MSLLDYFIKIEKNKKEELKELSSEKYSKEERVRLGRIKLRCKRVNYPYLFEEDNLYLSGYFIREIPQLKKYYMRLEKEFYLINEKNFSKVFLQVIDIIDLAGKEIPHIIRGSSGSSLICYLLGITEIDPIKENISLARFMHEKRDSIPDIDIDWPHNKREEIYKRIFQRWNGKVARISNHVMFKSKSALKEAIRRNGYHKFIPKEFQLQEIFDDITIQNKVLDEACDLENTFHNYSLHCGGIIIFDKEVPEEHYLQDFTMGTLQGSQLKLNKDEVEDYGFIKIDILSNRGLSQLEDIEKGIIEYPDTDPLITSLLSDGNNLGLTYAESRGIRKIFMKMKPRNIHDIAIGLALIRPAASSQKSEFLRNYDIKNMNDYIIYDDDAIQYIQRIMKCNESDADLWRKAFSKNNIRKKYVFKQELEKMYNNEKVDIIMEQLSNLQKYSFCKSHAISYAKLVWRLAWLKVYKPHEFWKATLNNCNSSYRKWVHYREAVASGLKITYGKKPYILDGNILKSEKNYSKQMKLKDDMMSDYFMYGYWCQTDFLPGMYVKYKEEIPMRYNRKTKKYMPISEKPIKTACFKGLVATSRPYNTDRHMKKNTYYQLMGGDKIKQGRKITFVTIGYENGKYIDLVLWGHRRIGHFIEGYGIVKCDDGIEWIEVLNIKN